MFRPDQLISYSDLWPHAIVVDSCQETDSGYRISGALVYLQHNEGWEVLSCGRTNFGCTFSEAELFVTPIGDFADVECLKCLEWRPAILCQ